MIPLAYYAVARNDKGPCRPLICAYNGGMAASNEYWSGVLAFVRVVESGSFTAAAHSIGMTPSAISKAVARLERRLGARLLQRSTRTLGLTQEGVAFYERVAPAVKALRDAEDTIEAASAPRGLLRVSAPIDLGRTLIASWVRDFALGYPDLKLELNVTDRFVDLWREGYDLALRMGSRPESTLTVQELGSIGYAVVASPQYLSAHEQVATIADLDKHACLTFLTTGGRRMPWSFGEDAINPDGPFDTDDGGALRTAALNGAGIAYLLRFAVEADLGDGSLVELFPDLRKPVLPVYALHAFQDRLPTRALVFLDFAKERLASHHENRVKRIP